MRGATCRGGDPRGAFVFRVEPVAVGVFEDATGTDAYTVEVGILGSAFDAAAADTAFSGNVVGLFLEQALASADQIGTAHAFGFVDGASDATDVNSVASVLLVEVASGALSADAFSALAKAAATYLEAAAAEFTTFAADYGAELGFVYDAALASEAYTAAAMDYGRAVDAATAADAMEATAQALARYADPAAALDMQYARASTDSAGPLRGAINIVAAVRGIATIEPSPGSHGKTSH